MSDSRKQGGGLGLVTGQVGVLLLVRGNVCEPTGDVGVLVRVAWCLADVEDSNISLRWGVSVGEGWSC